MDPKFFPAMRICDILRDDNGKGDAGDVRVLQWYRVVRVMPSYLEHV